MNFSRSSYTNLLCSLGFTDEESRRLEYEISSNRIDESEIMYVDKEDLVRHISQNSCFKKYSKEAICAIIKDYSKKNDKICLNSDFKEFLDRNIEEADQYLWGIMEEDSDSVITCSLVSNKDKQDYRNLISGIISSTLSRTIVAPLDRLRLLYQVNYIGTKKPPSLFKGFSLIYSTEGFRGFFKGNFVNILKGSPENGIKFYTFEFSKQKLQTINGEQLCNFQLFFLGAISGLISTTIMFPLEVIKVRISTTPKGYYKGILDVFRKIGKEPKGFLNLYSGLEASVCMTIPNAGLNLAFYENLKILVSGKYSSNNAASIPFPILMLIGGLSAVSASIFLYPFHLTQSRMIMFNLKTDELKEGFNTKSPFFQSKFFRVIRATLKLDGVLGFYKGFLPGSGKIFFGNGLGYGIYEHTRKLLGVSKEI